MRKDIKEVDCLYQVDEQGRFWSKRTNKQICKTGKVVQFTISGKHKICRTKNSLYGDYFPDLHKEQKRCTSESSPILKRRLRCIISRCYNKEDKQYPNYGGRGIDVYHRWLADSNDFVNYCLEIGYKKHLSVDRIDNNKGYHPDNIRFATSFEQNNNMRSNIIVNDGEEQLTLSQFCKKHKLNYKSIHGKMQRRYNGDTSLMLSEFKSGKLFKKHFNVTAFVRGEQLSIREISEKYNLTEKVVKTRIERGDKDEQIIRQVRERRK